MIRDRFRWVAVLAALCSLANTARAEPLDKPVVGPKLICFKYSTFRLAADERVTASSGSPEGMSLTVEGPAGRYDVGESEIFKRPEGPKRLVLTSGKTRVFRMSDRRSHYAIYGPTSFSDGKEELVIWLSGTGLKGNKDDRAVYERFEVRDPAGLKCPMTFTYSWE